MNKGENEMGNNTIKTIWVNPAISSIEKRFDKKLGQFVVITINRGNRVVEDFEVFQDKLKRDIEESRAKGQSIKKGIAPHWSQEEMELWESKKGGNKLNFNNGF